MLSIRTIPYGVSMGFPCCLIKATSQWLNLSSPKGKATRGWSIAGRSKDQYPALFERQDCTLLKCYHLIYARRTGGAYDSHNRTAGVAGRARRRVGRVVARGGAGAGGDAGAWLRPR